MLPKLYPVSRDVIDGLKRGLLIGAVAAVVGLPVFHVARTHWFSKSAAVASATHADTSAANIQVGPRFANFGSLEPPSDVRRIADWATDSRDSRGLDFIVLDKREAHVYVFNPDGSLRDHSPVLLGAAAGDDTSDGVGQKALHDVKPEERTTPAGRFVGESGRNANGEDVFWVDYQAAVSMHRVRQIEASERRLERLATPTAADNRISYGCINLPKEFYESVMVPTFLGRRGLVYVLPENRTFEEVFPTAYDVATRYNATRREASAE